VVFVPELPRTRSAKILRRAIRATVAGEDPGDLSSLENPSSIEAIRRATGEPTAPGGPSS
jgi:acetyl-CoA synthetase